MYKPEWKIEYEQVQEHCGKCAQFYNHVCREHGGARCLHAMKYCTGPYSPYSFVISLLGIVGVVLVIFELINYVIN